MAQQICVSEPETGRLAASRLSRAVANLRRLCTYQLENDTMLLPGGSRRALNINSHLYEYKK